ncbi:MAG: U32 family peptidase [Clostridia bacterium]|nr:U32 family peptidase [Clostridia bacterium]
MKKPELLAPAGNFTKLKTAFAFGADAVYIGGEYFSLRAQADNFTMDEINDAVALANKLNKKIFVTMNIISRDQDIEPIIKYAKELEEIGVHGVIIADIGTFMAVREACPSLKIHVSTQANNLNWRTCNFWFENGAERINLARELSIEEISSINSNLLKMHPELAERDEATPYLEAFVHGAMCMSFSGRCMLSDYLTGRSSNRGDCAQPCRWNYHIAEEKRPGEYMPIEENDRGTFIFNSKDLCMIKYLPELIKAGVGSLKIEGRMKSEFYTAVTTRAYRRAIDECCKDIDSYSDNIALLDELMKELCSVSHRDYSTGFYLGKRGEQIFSSSSYSRDSDFTGVVISSETISGNELYETVFCLKGAFNTGDELEFLIPGESENKKITVEKMRNAKGEYIERAANAMMEVTVETPFYAEVGTVIRKWK